MRYGTLVLMGVLALAWPSQAILGQERLLLRVAQDEGSEARYVWRLERRRVADTLPMSDPGVFVQSIELRGSQRVTSLDGEVRVIRQVIDSVHGEPTAPLGQAAGDTLVRLLRMDARGRVLSSEVASGPTDAGSYLLARAIGAMIVLPLDSVSIGETWVVDQLPTSDLGLWRMLYAPTVTYSLQEVAESSERREATLSFDAALRRRPDGDPSLQATGSVSGSLVFDMERGRWIRHDVTLVTDIRGYGNISKHKVRYLMCLLESPNVSCGFVVETDDLAYDRGVFTGEATMKESGTSVPLNGKYLWIARRVSDGSWRYTVQMWSDNQQSDSD